MRSCWCHPSVEVRTYSNHSVAGPRSSLWFACHLSYSPSSFPVIAQKAQLQPKKMKNSYTFNYIISVLRVLFDLRRCVLPIKCRLYCSFPKKQANTQHHFTTLKIWQDPRFNFETGSGESSGLLMVLPKAAIGPLWLIQNIAARVVTRTQKAYDSSSTAQPSHRIDFKMLLLVHTVFGY